MKPGGESWAEWRMWAVVNLLVATGVRANTVVNIKICDVGFEHNIIRLRKLKNRKQQFVPMSTSLNAALSLYLKVLDWDTDPELCRYIISKQATKNKNYDIIAWKAEFSVSAGPNQERAEHYNGECIRRKETQYQDSADRYSV